MSFALAEQQRNLLLSQPGHFHFFRAERTHILQRVFAFPLTEAVQFIKYRAKVGQLKIKRAGRYLFYPV
ncbi:hypothetical protein D3C85_1089840 [compost metagenome]